MHSEPSVPDPAHPEQTYEELQAELTWHRERLHAADTALRGIGTLANAWQVTHERAVRHDGGAS
jgi:hypothetical protein